MAGRERALGSWDKQDQKVVKEEKAEEQGGRKWGQREASRGHILNAFSDHGEDRILFYGTSDTIEIYDFAKQDLIYDFAKQDLKNKLLSVSYYTTFIAFNCTIKKYI